ncbi:isocitrate lyase/PEP mutase family protein [Peptoniphilus sp. SGI.035]|uniref:isocitrate lyase/PEP mutase family protein n=1 Tax=Peptoniphilus sp. SGI.035 TaxID=3420564 RepID=UPI003CFCAC35
MNKTKDLRKMINENEFIMIPGIYDCVSAKYAEKAGFKCLFLSGGSLAYAKLGLPDIGLLNVNDFSESIINISNITKLPLITDMDNGFGNAIHAAHAASLYEKCGASGLQIDDKLLPASTPTSHEVVDFSLIGPKIKAIRDSVSKDFVIVYRTAANMYDYGIDKAIERVNKAKELGADCAYVDGLKDLEQVKKVSKEAEIKLMINLNEKGFPASLSFEELSKYNYKLGLYPMSSILSTSFALERIFEDLIKNKSTLKSRDKMISPALKLYNLMGLESITKEYSKYYDEEAK